MKTNQNRFFAPFALYLLLTVVAFASEANQCLNLFNDSLVVEQSAVEQLYSKAEIEALFRVRERLKTSQNGTAKIFNSVEAGIISRITGKDMAPWKFVTLKDFDEQVILKAFRGLAYDLAWKAHQRYPKVPLEDLRQAALMGLWVAVGQYEADSVFMFSSVATNHIKASISETLAALAYPVGTSPNTHTMMGRIVRFQIDLRKELGREPTVEDILAAHNKKYKLQITKEKVVALLKWRKFLSTGIVDSSSLKMNKDVDNPDQFEVDIAAQVKDTRPNPEEIAHFKSVQSKLAEALIELRLSHEREIESVLRLYGIVLTGDSRNPGLALTNSKTLEVAAAEMPRGHGEGIGITRERIRQMEVKGRRLVRRYLGLNYPKDFPEIDSLLQAIVEMKSELLDD